MNNESGSFVLLLAIVLGAASAALLAWGEPRLMLGWFLPSLLLGVIGKLVLDGQNDT